MSAPLIAARSCRRLRHEADNLAATAVRTEQAANRAGGPWLVRASRHMNQIATLDLGASMFFDHRDPEQVARLNSLRRAT